MMAAEEVRSFCGGDRSCIYEVLGAVVKTICVVSNYSKKFCGPATELRNHPEAVRAMVEFGDDMLTTWAKMLDVLGRGRICRGWKCVEVVADSVQVVEELGETAVASAGLDRIIDVRRLEEVGA